MRPVTPQTSYPELAQAIGVPVLYLKREDLHPYGSHKGRSLPAMIAHHYAAGWRDFVISSSGNAALAAIQAIQALPDDPNDPVTLQVFVGAHIDQTKFELLRHVAQNPLVNILMVENPKQTAFQLEQGSEAKNLRQSTDDTALIGYAALADELAMIPHLAAVFVPTSSGTTAEGISKRFLELNVHPQIHIAQTGVVHPIAETFDTQFKPEMQSLAGAIVDKVAHRRETVIKEIRLTDGSGWVINNQQIKNAQQLVLEKTGLSLSPNSALSIAALQKAVAAGWEWHEPVVCLVTGL